MPSRSVGRMPWRVALYVMRILWEGVIALMPSVALPLEVTIVTRDQRGVVIAFLRWNYKGTGQLA
jgi:hypothetical protein